MSSEGNMQIAIGETVYLSKPLAVIAASEKCIRAGHYLWCSVAAGASNTFSGGALGLPHTGLAASSLIYNKWVGINVHDLSLLGQFVSLCGSGFVAVGYRLIKPRIIYILHAFPFSHCYTAAMRIVLINIQAAVPFLVQSMTAHKRLKLKFFFFFSSFL